MQSMAQRTQAFGIIHPARLKRAPESSSDAMSSLRTAYAREPELLSRSQPVASYRAGFYQDQPGGIIKKV